MPDLIGGPCSTKSDHTTINGLERLKTTTYMGNVERIETEGENTITWRQRRTR